MTHPPEPDGPTAHDAGVHADLSGSAGDVVQARDILGGVHFHDTGAAHDARIGPVPQELPGDVRGFVDRDAEFARLDEAVFGGPATDPAQPRVALPVIVGTAGVGKTSFALRWAYRVRDRFPDGQLYANLRGFDPGPPITPDQVLDHFLRSFGLPDAAIPAGTEAMAARYRSLLAGRRVLVILDNAGTAAQVRPLLPNASGSLVLVTSRRDLSTLAVRDGAYRLTLDLLPTPAAVELLTGAILPHRPPGDDPAEVTELAGLCARLPLALRIAGERAALRPRTPLRDLIADLRDESGLWEALSTGDDDDQDAVRTVFAWSYRALPLDAARLFRLLGLHPGPDLSDDAAAALAGVPRREAQRLLDVLLGAHLLEEAAARRYQFHDLLRAFARHQAESEETEGGRRDVLRRLLAWYLHTADAALAAVAPLEPRIGLGPPSDGVQPIGFDSDQTASGWFETERPNLLAAVQAAADAGLHGTAWRLAVTLRMLYARRNAFHDWLTTSRLGLASARADGERRGEADLLESLAMAAIQSGNADDGAEGYAATLSIRRDLGDTLGEALALNGLGLADLRRGRMRDAAVSFGRAEELFRALGDPGWVAVTQVNNATALAELGGLAQAEYAVRAALEVNRQSGDDEGAGDALRLLARIQRERGDTSGALASATGAVALASAHRNPMWEGYWLIELGQCLRAVGRPADALEVLHRSAVIHRDLYDRAREAEALDATGLAYADLGRVADAEPFHRVAAATFRELGDMRSLGFALGHLASSLDGAARREAAFAAWRECASLLAGFDDPRAQATAARAAARLSG